MAILIFSGSFSGDGFREFIEDHLSEDATVNNIGGFLATLVAIDITSANPDDTNGANIGPTMSRLGFTLLTANGDAMPNTVRHWGSFDTANAPTTGVQPNDIGSCTDGNLGELTPCYYDGTHWRSDVTGAQINASTNGVATASVDVPGSYLGIAGNYAATQASTTGSGTGAEFTVTFDDVSGEITAVVSVDIAGSGYAVNDNIALNIPGLAELSAAELNVDSLT